MKRAWLSAVLLGAGLASLSASACHSEVDAQLALAGPSGKCRLNSDCAELLVCVFERCHEECSTSRDCEDDTRCVQSSQTRNVCQLPDEQSCSKDGRCPGSQLCGVDAECRDGCASNDDCVEQQVCASGSCADMSELGPEGQLSADPERPATSLVPCGFDSDCPGTLRCAAGRCSAECESARDCGRGESCQDGACQQTETPPECRRNSDCPADRACEAGSCVALPEAPTPACVYDSDCTQVGEHCSRGECWCECELDTDCARGLACANGCACEPGIVIEGNVLVSDAAELALLENVKGITGKLTLTIAQTGTFHVPHLKTVGSIDMTYAGSIAAPTFVLDALETVTGTFNCAQTCVAPRLWKAGSVVSSSPTMRELSFPSLKETDKVVIDWNQQLVSLRFASLTRADIFSVSGNTLLVELVAPLLHDVDRLTVKNFNGTKLALPLAAPSINAAVSGGPNLEVLELPAVASLSAAFSLSYLPKLTTLNVDALNSADEISIGSTGLTSLEAFSFAAFKSTTKLDFTLNPALPTCAVTDLKAKLEAALWGGTLTQSDNLVCQ